jgi:hypothetical protein
MFHPKKRFFFFEKKKQKTFVALCAYRDSVWPEATKVFWFAQGGFRLSSEKIILRC